MSLAFVLPGPTETIIIAGILVLIFGATRLPKLARSTGSSIMQFKLGLREAKSELQKLEAEDAKLQMELDRDLEEADR